MQPAGFAFADGLTASSTTVVSCANGATTEPGLVLIPGGTTTCTVTLQQLGTITAQTSWDMIDINGNHISYSNVGSIAVTAQLLDSSNNPTGPVFSGTSSSTGALTLTGTTTTEGLASGRYQIKASPTGFTPFVGTVTIDAGHAMISDTGDVEVDAGVAQIRLETVAEPVAEGHPQQLGEPRHRDHARRHDHLDRWGVEHADLQDDPHRRA